MRSIFGPGVWQSAWAFIACSSISITLNLLWHSSIRAGLSENYPGDSFHTLSTSAAAGLIFLSSFLCLFVLLTSWVITAAIIHRIAHKTKRFGVAFFIFDIVTTLSIYLVSLIFAPQIYYTYYQSIFQNLPTQSVVRWITPESMLEILKLPLGASTSDHLAGVTAWVLVTTLILQWLRHYIFKIQPLPN